MVNERHSGSQCNMCLVLFILVYHSLRQTATKAAALMTADTKSPWGLVHRMSKNKPIKYR